MKTVTITKGNFLDWYFNNCSDDEREYTILSLGKAVIDALLEGKTFTYDVESTFRDCETSVIPIYLLEEFSDDHDSAIEVADLSEEVEVKLI